MICGTWIRIAFPVRPNSHPLRSCRYQFFSSTRGALAPSLRRKLIGSSLANQQRLLLFAYLAQCTQLRGADLSGRAFSGSQEDITHIWLWAQDWHAEPVLRVNPKNFVLILKHLNRQVGSRLFVVLFAHTETKFLASMPNRGSRSPVSFWGRPLSVTWHGQIPNWARQFSFSTMGVPCVTHHPGVGPETLRDSSVSRDSTRNFSIVRSQLEWWHFVDGRSVFTHVYWSEL